MFARLMLVGWRNEVVGKLGKKRMEVLERRNARLARAAARAAARAREKESVLRRQLMRDADG